MGSSWLEPKFGPGAIDSYWGGSKERLSDSIAQLCHSLLLFRFMAWRVAPDQRRGLTIESGR